MRGSSRQSATTTRCRPVRICRLPRCAPHSPTHADSPHLSSMRTPFAHSSTQPMPISPISAGCSSLRNHPRDRAPVGRWLLDCPDQLARICVCVRLCCRPVATFPNSVLAGPPGAVVCDAVVQGVNRRRSYTGPKYSLLCPNPARFRPTSCGHRCKPLKPQGEAGSQGCATKGVDGSLGTSVAGSSAVALGE